MGGVGSQESAIFCLPCTWVPSRSSVFFFNRGRLIVARENRAGNCFVCGRPFEKGTRGIYSLRFFLLQVFRWRFSVVSAAAEEEGVLYLIEKEALSFAISCSSSRSRRNGGLGCCVCHLSRWHPAMLIQSTSLTLMILLHLVAKWGYTQPTDFEHGKRSLVFLFKQPVSVCSCGWGWGSVFVFLVSDLSDLNQFRLC